MGLYPSWLIFDWSLTGPQRTSPKIGTGQRDHPISMAKFVNIFFKSDTKPTKLDYRTQRSPARSPSTPRSSSTTRGRSPQSSLWKHHHRQMRHLVALTGRLPYSLGQGDTRWEYNLDLGYPRRRDTGWPTWWDTRFHWFWLGLFLFVYPNMRRWQLGRAGIPNGWKTNLKLKLTKPRVEQH